MKPNAKDHVYFYLLTQRKILVNGFAEGKSAKKVIVVLCANCRAKSSSTWLMCLQYQEEFRQDATTEPFGQQADSKEALSG